MPSKRIGGSTSKDVGQTVNSVIAPVVRFSVLAGLIGLFFTALAGLVLAFLDTNITTGNSTADALLPVFGLIIAIVGVIKMFQTATDD